ncbi:MAG: hypothetical protein AAGK47_01810 [Bacteroidota bacterium]
MNHLLGYSLVLVMFIAITGCAEEPKPDPIIHIESSEEGKLSIDINTDRESLEQTAKSLGNRISESINEIDINFKNEDGEAVEAVDFRLLKARLPEYIADLKRTQINGQRSGMFGVYIATADAKYKDGDQSIAVQLTDIGGMGMALDKLAKWSEMDIDNESEDGYERTTTIGGHPAFVAWKERQQRGQISVLVNQRLVVNLKSRNVAMDQLEAALDDISLRKLARL